MTDLTDTLRLAEALCARVCHDLSGMLGTLGGSLELLQHDLADESEALTLASDSALALQQRLQLLRAAWGANPEPLALPALRKLAAGLPRAAKLTLDLKAIAPTDVFGPEVGRAVLALLLLAAGSLPVGGSIALAGTPTDLIIAIAGRNAAWPSGLPACLRDDLALRMALGDPRRLAMPLAILFARSSGLRLSLLLAGGPTGNAPPPLRLAAG